MNQTKQVWRVSAASKWDENDKLKFGSRARRSHRGQGTCINAIF
ncbi:hypothetical protein FACS1894122_11710 [Alphaproteobacteria bacterium]|nr:hypothetical protein FACS1894122_11710 [Alphaproteobacteria bacterium]